MAFKPFKKIKTGVRETDQLQENIEQSLKPLLKKEVIDGLLLKDVDLEASVDNFIEHKLNRELLGYVIVKKNMPTVINDKQATNEQSDRFLILNCTVSVRVSLWLF